MFIDDRVGLEKTEKFAKKLNYMSGAGHSCSRASASKLGAFLGHIVERPLFGDFYERAAHNGSYGKSKYAMLNHGKRTGKRLMRMGCNLHFH